MCWDRLIDAEEPAHARKPDHAPAALPEPAVESTPPEPLELVAREVHAA